MDPKELIGEAQLLFAEGKLEESIERFTKALDAGADPFMVYLSRGAAHIKLKYNDKAIADFDKAIEVNSKNPRAFYYRGLGYIVNDEFEKAVADFTKALELKPDLYTAKFARATAYTRLHKYEEAAQDIRAVLPQIEANLQGVVDTYGIVRTEMWKVMALLSGEKETPTVSLKEQEIETLKKWLLEK